MRLGLPDRFVEHGERAELLAELGLNVEGLCRTVRQALERRGERKPWGVGQESYRTD